MKTRLYTKQDIQQILGKVGLDSFMDQAIESLYLACREYKQNRYEAPVRDGFEYKLPELGLTEWMPIHAIGNLVTLKVVGYHPSNPLQRYLPSVLSCVFQLDTSSGQLVNIMDCTFTTSIRTGAASAVASRILSKEDPKVLGIIGCGAQAITQLHALSRLFRFDEILVHDTNLECASTFQQRAETLRMDRSLIRITSLNELSRKADILCTTTSVDIGQGPVFNDLNLKPDLHINAVGSDFPGKIEVPRSVLLRSLVCPDFALQAKHEGECQQLNENQIGPDLVSLVQQSDKYQGYKNLITVFDSTGWALEDHVMANLVSHYGQQFGLGEDIELNCVSDDPKNPYGFLLHQSPAGSKPVLQPEKRLSTG